MTDSDRVTVVSDIEKVRVTYDLPFSLQIGGGGRLITENFVGDVKINVIRQEPSKFPGLETTSGAYMEYDDTNFLEYTKVTFEFELNDCEYLAPESIQERDKSAFEYFALMPKFHQAVEESANKLISSARIALDLFFLQPVHDVCRLGYIDVEVCRAGSDKFERNSIGQMFPSGGLSNRKPQKSKRQLELFSRLNQSGGGVASSVTFMLDARYQFVKKQYYYSALLACCGFEFFLKELLTLIANRYPDSKNTKQWIKDKTLPVLAQQGMQKAFGAALNNRKRWGAEVPEFYESVKLIRDMVVHRDLKNLDGTEFAGMDDEQIAQRVLENCEKLRRGLEQEAVNIYPKVLEPLK